MLAKFGGLPDVVCVDELCGAMRPLVDEFVGVAAVVDFRLGEIDGVVAGSLRARGVEDRPVQTDEQLRSIRKVDRTCCFHGIAVDRGVETQRDGLRC